VVLTTAFAALLCLPCAVFVAIRSEHTTIRRVRVRRSRAELAALRRLDQGLRDLMPAPIRSALPSTSALPSIEQATAELRRLDRQRRTGPTSGSEMWLAAVLRAYDQWLQVACWRLGVTQQLSALDGIDRDFERLRVESELTAAGLQVRAPH
jgi:hypothetical protein